MVNLNQIKKQYKDSVSEIPEKKLKELYDSLYYEAYYALFIEKDDEAHQKALNMIETLSKENEPWKVYRASVDASVWVPLQILSELHNKGLAERRELAANLFMLYFVFLESDTNFLNVLIDYIDEGKDEKDTLKFIREQLVKVKDATSNSLSKNQDKINEVIEYYESKEVLSEVDLEGLERLKEIEEGV